jgi:hypothetical protein
MQQYSNLLLCIFRSVRHAVLFAVSMVILSVPGHLLLTDLQCEVMETKRWLEGKMKYPDK